MTDEASSTWKIKPGNVRLDHCGLLTELEQSGTTVQSRGERKKKKHAAMSALIKDIKKIKKKVTGAYPHLCDYRNAHQNARLAMHAT